MVLGRAAPGPRDRGRASRTACLTGRGQDSQSAGSPLATWASTSDVRLDL